MDELQAVLAEKLKEAEDALDYRETQVAAAKVALSDAFKALHEAKVTLAEMRRRNLLNADGTPMRTLGRPRVKPQAPELVPFGDGPRTGTLPALDADPTLAGAAEEGGEGE